MRQTPGKYLICMCISICSTACEAQERANESADQASDATILLDGTPTLVKTQNSQSGDNVHCILEDQSGKLWFGTTGEGLYIYDGTSFQQFTDESGLRSNTVHCLLEDSDGRIWIGTGVGLCRYDDGENGIIWFGGGGRGLCQYDWEKTTCFNAEDGLSNEDVWSILEDSSGNLWLGTRNTGLFRYDGERFASFSDSNGK
jgi:ligand-binding sensor domain-containing protein